MAFKFEVVSNSKDVADLLGELAKKGMPSEAAKALNRTITFVRNEVATEVSMRTGLSRALIKRRVKQIRNRRASPQHLVTEGFVGEVAVAVSKATPKPRRAGQGVTYKTLPNTPHDPRAFFARMPSGKRSAFVRTGTGRLPVTEITLKIGPYLRRSTRRVMRQPAAEFYSKVVTDNMEARMKKEIAKRGLAWA